MRITPTGASGAPFWGIGDRLSSPSAGARPSGLREAEPAIGPGPPAMGRHGACPGCGYPGGREACRALFDDSARRVRELAWTGSLRTWRLMHDVYALQHDDFRGHVADLVVHLGGMCWALEQAGDEPGYRALRRLAAHAPYDAPADPPEPGMPVARGELTVACLDEREEADVLAAGVERWARATWLAFAPLHAAARRWVFEALTLRS